MTDDTKKDDASFDSAQDKLKALELKCEEYLNGWKRERADFLNYKKAEMERIGDLAKYANEEVLLKIIPILDNIYLAELHIPEEFRKENPSTGSGRATKSWLDGFVQIKNQLTDFLAKEGIEPIETIGKPFDPTTMESVEEVVGNPTSHNSGSVAEETQRGYTIHGKIIRVAKVKVTK